MKISEVLKWDKIKFTKKGNKKYYSIISVLEELDVSKRARKYWYDAKKKIEKSDKKILQNIESLKVEASDWKNRVLDCASKSDIELILKNIPSKKVKSLFDKDKKKKTSLKKAVRKVEEEKKSTKKAIKKEAKKEVKKEVKKETKKAVKKVSNKNLEKKHNKVEKAAKKAIKKETKKVVKDIDESKILKKSKWNKKVIKKVIKKSVKKEIKKDVKKKKCWIICGIIKIFA